MEYVTESTLNNIYERKSNVFGIISNPTVVNCNNKSFGKVKLLISIKNKKKIFVNDIVEFNSDKIQWKSTKFDEKGCTLCLVDPHWCRMYIHNPKIKCPVRVLKSEVKNLERIYYGQDEYLEMNKDQFIKRRLLLKFAKYPYFIIKACENFNDRYWASKKYYKALNETAKHYLIKHEQLKEYISEYNNAKKEFNKEWNTLLLKHYQNNEGQRDIDVLLEGFSTKENKSNIINFSLKP